MMIIFHAEEKRSVVHYSILLTVLIFL